MRFPPAEKVEKGDEYKLIRSVDYENIPDFVIEQIRQPNTIMIIFFALFLGMAAWALSLRITLSACFSVTKLLPFTFAGAILLPILLIPVHEGIHVATLWLLGGRNIRVGADLKNFLIYVISHRQVIGPRSFLTIALSPFLIISIAMILLIYTLTPLWQWAIALGLVVHTTMCAGDMAMAAFYYSHRKKKIYTMDDADAKVACFYEKLNTESPGTSYRFNNYEKKY